MEAALAPLHIAMTGETTSQDADRQLLERMREGDREAFSELVRRHQRQLFYLVWRYVKNDADAKDVVQAAFVKAWQNTDSFRGDSSFRTWLYRIGVNLALNHVRDSGRWKMAELTEEHASQEMHGTQRLVEQEAAQELRKAVETLPPKQRLVVELRVHEGLSFREVAEIASCSEDAAKANFHHAIKRLRSELGNAE